MLRHAVPCCAVLRRAVHGLRSVLRCLLGLLCVDPPPGAPARPSALSFQSHALVLSQAKKEITITF